MLILLSVCFAITSCKDNTPEIPQNSDTESDTTSPESDGTQPEASTPFAENGQINYTLVRPDLVNDAFKSSITALFADV